MSPEKKTNFHDKVASKLFILALPLPILLPILPMLIMSLPPKTSTIFTSAVALYFVLSLLILAISLFFSSNIMTRLSAIPISFVIALFGFIIYRLKIYRKVLNAFSIGEPFSLTSETVDPFLNTLPLIVIVGIWISILPLIIYSLSIYFKNTKKKNLADTIKGVGYVMSVVDTHTMINKNRIYHVVLDVQPEMGQSFVAERGQSFVAEKDFLIPNHVLHLISIGTNVDVRFNSKNPNDIYIITEYGVL